MSLQKWQRKYLVASAVLLPTAPFLYLQGLYARWKIGVLPDAGGERTGVIGGGGEPASLFAIGESTVAGLGARSHEYALTGRFAEQLHRRIGRPIEWTVVGKSGVTAERTIEHLLPQMPAKPFDYILVGLGGNDVLKLSSPRKWRTQMERLLGELRSRSPEAVIFLSNCPMIKLSPALPQPIKGILWELSKLHDANIHDLTRELDRVYYYPQPRELKIEGFFADGIHPSEQGYKDWAEAMMEHFDTLHKW